MRVLTIVDRYVRNPIVYRKRYRFLLAVLASLKLYDSSASTCLNNAYSSCSMPTKYLSTDMAEIRRYNRMGSNDIFAQFCWRRKGMTELNIWFEYLYEESASVRLHGLRSILKFLVSSDMCLSTEDVTHLTRILQRLLSDDASDVTDASVLILTIDAIFATLKGDRGGDEVISRYENLRRGLRRFEEAVPSSGDPCTQERILHLSMLAIPIPGAAVCRFIPSDIGSLVQVVQRSQYDPLKVSSLRLLAEISIVRANQEFILSICPLINELLSSSNAVRDATLELCYNLSFNRDFLDMIDMASFLPYISTSTAVRVLINFFAIHSGSSMFGQGVAHAIVSLLGHHNCKNVRDLKVLLQASSWGLTGNQFNTEELVSKTLLSQDSALLDALTFLPVGSVKLLGLELNPSWSPHFMRTLVHVALVHDSTQAWMHDEIKSWALNADSTLNSGNEAEIQRLVLACPFTSPQSFKEIAMKLQSFTQSSMRRFAVVYTLTVMPVDAAGAEELLDLIPIEESHIIRSLKFKFRQNKKVFEELKKISVRM